MILYFIYVGNFLLVKRQRYWSSKKKKETEILINWEIKTETDDDLSSVNLLYCTLTGEMMIEMSFISDIILNFILKLISIKWNYTANIQTTSWKLSQVKWDFQHMIGWFEHINYVQFHFILIPSESPFTFSLVSLTLGRIYDFQF